MKTKDLDIKDHYYYPDFDAFLIRAWRPGTGKRLPCAVVGWMLRTNPAELIKPRSFPDIPAAMDAFTKIQGSKQFPDKLLDIKDQQVQRVYDWEDMVLRPDADTPLDDPKVASKLIHRIAREMHIRCPKLIWAEPSSHSEYDEDSNTIEFGHRALLPLLHEMAHAVHKQWLEEADCDNAAHHSPGFVWHAIDLYHRYAGLELDYLVQSASLAGILGPLHVRDPEYYIQPAMKISGPPVARFG